MQVATTSFVQPSSSPKPVVVVETAYEWFQRSQRARIAQSVKPPQDPSAAAWAFCRPTTTNSSTSSAAAAAAAAVASTKGTGIAFVDAALRSSSVQLPVVDVRGAADTGKTWTVVSLAARFVVATKLSQFLLETRHGQQQQQEQQSMMLDREGSMRPQVIIFDSQYNVTLPKLVYAVRSLLLLRLSGSGTATSTTTTTTQEENEQEWQDKAIQFEQDMQDCLSRIQIAHSPQGDLTGWVPILETTRDQLAQTAADHPTLILWDGFLSEPDASTEGARMEVIRQMERLLLDCSVLLITTTTTIAQESGSLSSAARSSNNGHNRREWERFITHRIRLDRSGSGSSSSSATAHNDTSNNHEYLASVHGAQIPFSISMAGILS